MRNSYRIFVLLLLTALSPATGGEIRGHITSASGKTALAYASISVKGTFTGTLTNGDGFYVLQLEPGTYDIHFQYLGYKTAVRQVDVKLEPVILDVELEEQPLSLKELQVGKNTEDPAYTIMRKAIAKSKFHQLQIQSYKAKVYAKSTALPTKIPRLMKGSLKKQGIEEGVAFVNESISEVSYKRPNSYTHRVLSTRNNLDNSAPTPNEFIFASFYNPEVAGTVSPLSPRAFSSYRFEYEGFFDDRGEIVNKIKVIPKNYKEGVFKGSIYILENRWSIHSFNLQTIRQGFDIDVRQIFTPDQDIWIPTNQHFNIRGNYLGFSGQFTYVVSIRYQQLQVDPRLKDQVEIVDQKATKEPTPKIPGKADAGQLLAGKNKFSVKDFRKTVKKYEKQQKEEALPEGKREVRRDSIVIEPLAHQRDSAYWEASRTVPLTPLEKISYTYQDSIALRANNSRSRTDSTTFKMTHLLAGATYRYGKGHTLRFPPLIQYIYYNPVEGLNITLSPEWQKRFNASKRLTISPDLHYAAGRNRLSPAAVARFSTNKWGVSVEGGERIMQVNPDNPIPQSANTFAYLLFNRNHIRLYQKSSIRLGYDYRRLMDIISFNAGFEYSIRSGLVVMPEARQLLWGQPYLPRNSNTPQNAETGETDFGRHYMAQLDMALAITPWQKYQVRNGRKRYLQNSGPEFDIRYRKGIPVGKSMTDYDYLEGGVRYNLRLTGSGRLQAAGNAGGFLRTENLAFPDYRHFAGGRILAQTGDPLTQYRLLPYYYYSTSSRFVQGHLSWTSQKMLFTQIPLIRMTGLKEYLQLHLLSTPRISWYTEQVFGIDGLLKVFRLEVATRFHGTAYQKTGFRIGTNFTIR